MVAGLAYVGIGISYMVAEPTTSRSMALAVAFAWWDIQLWGCIFILTGLLSILSSRWPPISKTWGYMVMTGLSTAWSMFYLTGILFMGSPWTNISGFLTWGLIGFLWWAISGLRNPGEEEDTDFTPLLPHHEGGVSA